MRLLYTVLLLLFLPCVVARLLWREPDTRRNWRRVAQRLGLSGAVALRARPIWLHAVSVGEVQATRPLVQFLRQRYPHCPLLITTGTVGGRQMVMQEYGARLVHHYLPYDLPLFVARFLNRFRPRLVVIMETEIWPNLYRACRQRAIPLLLVNARLSRRSVRGYRRLAGFTRAVLQDLDFVLAQSAADASRFQALGVPAARLAVSANLKYHVAAMDAQGLDTRMAGAVRTGRPVWIAGSTHAGEERVLLDLHRRLRQVLHAELLLILAPRRVERASAVLRLCQEQGLCVRRRSEAVTPQCAVWLLDTLGALRHCYPLADVAFVGGSLLPGLGGHNVLEPMACGVATITGAHVSNFSAVVAELVRQRALLQADDAEALQASLAQLLLASRQRAGLAKNGLAFIRQQAASLEPVVTLLARYIDRPAP